MELNAMLVTNLKSLSVKSELLIKFISYWSTYGKSDSTFVSTGQSISFKIYN